MVDLFRRLKHGHIQESDGHSVKLFSETIDIMSIDPDDVASARTWALERAKRCFNDAAAQDAYDPGSLLARFLREEGWSYLGLADCIACG